MISLLMLFISFNINSNVFIPVEKAIVKSFDNKIITILSKNKRIVLFRNKLNKEDEDFYTKSISQFDKFISKDLIKEIKEI